MAFRKKFFRISNSRLTAFGVGARNVVEQQPGNWYTNANASNEVPDCFAALTMTLWQFFLRSLQYCSNYL